MTAECGYCGFPVRGDHPVCTVQFRERQAEGVRRAHNDPDRLLDAAHGAVLLDRFTPDPNPFED